MDYLLDPTPSRKTVFGERSGMFPASIDGLHRPLATVSQEKWDYLLDPAPCRKDVRVGERSGMSPASTDGLHHPLAQSQERWMTFSIRHLVERLQESVKGVAYSQHRPMVCITCYQYHKQNELPSRPSFLPKCC